MEIFCKIPTLIAPEAQFEEVLECGCGVCRQVVNEAVKEDYYNYLDQLEKDGFEKVSGVEFLDSKFPSMNASYKKDDILVCVTYSTYWRRVYITCHPDMFSKPWTAKDVFKEVPGAEVEKAVHYGAGNYVIERNETEKEFQDFLALLEKSGFIKHVDNGTGIHDFVFHSIYIKENLVLTMTHIKRLGKTYLSAAFDLPLSKHLHFAKEYVEENKTNAKTELHMPELWWFGNSFVFKLKNGHFIISDGGIDTEARYLLDYLESLTPPNEKPIVEGWFISHSHRDHTGVLRVIANNAEELAKRIYVNGIYFNEPNDNVLNLDSIARADVAFLHKAATYLKTETGEQTEIYRPQTGQRYYFSDITVDIILGQEQLPIEEYSGDLNDSSTWCMFTIEGQKCLLGGDGDCGDIAKVMSIYDRNYFHLDMFATLHHTLNTKNEFTDYCTIKTVLGTRRGEPLHNKQANQHLKNVSQEWLRTDKGTQILTFPYQVGTSKVREPFEWIYHKDSERP